MISLSKWLLTVAFAILMTNDHDGGKPGSQGSGNPVSKADVQRVRDAYDKSKGVKHRRKVLWMKAKHKARKLRHRLKRIIKHRHKWQDKHRHTHGDYESKLDAKLDWCHWAVGIAASFHYAQTRPIVYVLSGRSTRENPMTTDCSGSDCVAAKDAGLGDPLNQDFSGYGYTGTELQSEHISRADAKAGDDVVFGGGNGTHTCTLMEDGTAADPMLFSHGQESGPSWYPLSVEVSAHGGIAPVFVKQPE